MQNNLSVVEFRLIAILDLSRIVNVREADEGDGGMETAGTTDQKRSQYEELVVEMRFCITWILCVPLQFDRSCFWNDFCSSLHFKTPLKNRLLLDYKKIFFVVCFTFGCV